VLAEAVTLGADGRSVVHSGSKRYTVAPDTGCPCADAQHRSKYCKHYVAVGVQQIARRLYAHDVESVAPTKEETPMLEDLTPTPTPEPVTPPSTPAPQAEPYAPSTLYLKARVGDVELSWTLRGSDEDVAQRAQRVLAYVAKLQAKQPEAPAQGEAPAAPSCPMHGAAKVKASKLFSGSYCTARIDADTFCKWQHKDK
jgi:hypothetical protein